MAPIPTPVQARPAAIQSLVNAMATAVQSGIDAIATLVETLVDAVAFALQVRSQPVPAGSIGTFAEVVVAVFDTVSPRV